MKTPDASTVALVLSAAGHVADDRGSGFEGGEVLAKLADDKQFCKDVARQILEDSDL